MTFYPAPTPPPTTVIYRQVSIGLAAFVRLKQWQGRRLTNGEVLDRLILALPAPQVPDTRRRRA